MKTIFKSISLAVLFVGIGSTAFAQLGAQETVAVNARVLKQIQLAHTDVNFGAIAAGGGATFLDPTGAASTNVGFVAAAGTLTIDATPEEDIRIEFPTYVTLVGPTAVDTLAYTPQITVAFGTQTVGSAAQTSSDLANNTTALGPPVTVTATGGSGRGPFVIVTTDNAATETATLFIGGELRLNTSITATPALVAVPSGQANGTYTANMVFNVLYAN